MASSHEQWCADLTAWRLANDGSVPRQRSGDAEEARLGKWLSKAVPRKTRSLGTRPTLQQLTQEEVCMLDAALAPGLCSSSVGSNMVTSSSDTSAFPNKRLRQKSPAPVAKGQSPTVAPALAPAVTGLGHADP
eukprot:12200602-Karenia_brevis.AAC.1